jgi:hypothetical protein
VCEGQIIQQWERTPAEAAEDIDLIIQILELIDGGE